jgi:hypothetical protein
MIVTWRCCFARVGRSATADSLRTIALRLCKALVIDHPPSYKECLPKRFPYPCSANNFDSHLSGVGNASSFAHRMRDFQPRGPKLKASAPVSEAESFAYVVADLQKGANPGGFAPNAETEQRPSEISQAGDVSTSRNIGDYIGLTCRAWNLASMSPLTLPVSRTPRGVCFTLKPRMTLTSSGSFSLAARRHAARTPLAASSSS